MKKRTLDITIAAIGLVLLTPLFVMVALAIRALLGSPVLFRQIRPGKDGKSFTMVKFRSMRDALDNEGEPLADNERLTALGKIIRSTSIDELPELWNVLKGDMSIVGPRPLLPEYLQLYSERQAKRHEVRPGITGWSQINGRNAIAWDEKLELDVWYVEHQSFMLDCSIILKTVGKVFAGSGVSADGQATVEPFRGTQKK
jgi:lipopolysaccharide/colanic/teichoic acid biosynthesis glycosyltransferase